MSEWFDLNALANPHFTAPANPLDLATRAQELKNSQLTYQNALAGYDAKMAQGNALLGATGADGRTDYAKARATMAADPAAAYGAADAFSAQNRSRHEDVLNQDEQLSWQEHARDAMAGAFIRAANNPTDANIRGAGAFISSFLPAARDQITTGTKNLLSIPTPVQRSEAIKTLAVSTLPGHERIAQTWGTPTSVDDGQTVQTGTQASGMDGGAFTPAAGVQRRTSPEFNSTYTNRTIMTPKGPVTMPMTQSQFDIYNGTHGGFTGRVDVTGNGASDLPATAVPVGAEEQAKVGLDTKNRLATSMKSYRDEETNYRNMAGLLGALNGEQFRGMTLAQASNYADKLGWGHGQYATLTQELTKAAAKTRQAMMDGGSGPHTNAGMEELSHISPSPDMTIPAALALVHEGITGASQNVRRATYAQKVPNPMDVPRSLSEYDALYDPRFATIQRLGPQEGREYAKTHIADKAQYAASVRKMAQAQRDGKYDFGLTPEQVDRILGQKNGR
ncbi:hypothetical protein [Gluconobacter oxydans]|uniref:hypothetical protein n=1 Tax=Gluconobacter oxydans TaxID=442 RepID=UPI00062C80A9|nr:hypothetical protein [Gluconobacter oxydans]